MIVFITKFLVLIFARTPTTKALHIATGINAKYSGEKLPVIRLVITAVTVPTQGPAIRLINTDPIESRNIGNCKNFAIPKPVKLIATATGINKLDIKEKSSFKLFIFLPP